jgi:thiamine-monophosphate kinase
MTTLRELGEFEVIRRLTAARGEVAGVVVGAGDDAAVLRLAPGVELVATTDAFVEGRHFLPAWCTPRAAGARLAEANLSDLAAMAATPCWALLSLGARAEHEAEALVEFHGGVDGALRPYGAGLVGGNLTSVEGAEWFSLTLLGAVAHGRAWTRSGARPGDLVAVSGWPGRAGCGLRLMQALGDGARAGEWAALLEAWCAPVARVALARTLAETGGVMAAVDISDGIAGDLGHLCAASGVGVKLDEAAWPGDPLLERAATRLDLPLDTLRFGPSDDYELVLAIDPARRPAIEQAARATGVPLSFVGRFHDAPGVLAVRRGDGSETPLPGAGFDHFATGG